MHRSSNHSVHGPRPLPHLLVALCIIIIGAAFTAHLHTSRVAGWWLPLVISLFAIHGSIIGGISWFLMRRSDKDCSDGHSHVLHHPRAYDWLAQMVTLFRERNFRHRIIDLAGLRSGERVLDVGCGTGTLLIEACRKTNSLFAQGIDRSAEMIAHARKKAETHGLDISFSEGSAAQLPFESSSFDVLFCTLMLHHLPVSMQIESVREMCRVLRCNGRMVLVDLEATRKWSSVFSLIGIIHLLHPRKSATAPDWPRIEEALRQQQGEQIVSRKSFWAGSVRAIVAQPASPRSADSGVTGIR